MHDLNILLQVYVNVHTCDQLCNTKWNMASRKQNDYLSVVQPEQQ